jgi:hypothetical protein
MDNALDRADENARCLNGPEGCEGAVHYRLPLSGTGVSFPRCDKHWDERLELEQGLRQRYPEQPPDDWSPLDAGEAWSEDDY